MIKKVNQIPDEIKDNAIDAYIERAKLRQMLRVLEWNY
jgi:hypothetical protein